MTNHEFNGHGSTIPETIKIRFMKIGEKVADVNKSTSKFLSWPAFKEDDC